MEVFVEGRRRRIFDVLDGARKRRRAASKVEGVVEERGRVACRVLFFDHVEIIK